MRIVGLLLIAAVVWAQCPVFTPDTTIGKIKSADKIFRFPGGYVAVVNEVRLDTDGSPVAYHPQNKGTTDLCNGLDPIVDGKRNAEKDKAISPCYAAVRAAMAANWKRSASPAFCIYGFEAPGKPTAAMKCNAWGGEFGTGEIPLQDANDPAPGFFVSTTATANPAVTATSKQSKYLDSDRIPYVVVPRALIQKSLIPRNGVAWAWNPQTNKTAAAVFGDTQSVFGEISVAFAQQIEKGTLNPITPAALNGGATLPWPYFKRKSGEVRLGYSPKGPVVFVYFSSAPAPALTDYAPEKINGAANALLNSNGGAERLKQCLRPLL